jgi:hypothetical protein
MIYKLTEKLKVLANNYGVIGIKQSFEDEGIEINDLILVRRLTDICNIECFVKIGGCEAKSDINNCIKYGVNNIIAPMIESSFAVSKVTDITSKYNKLINSYIVVETKTSFNNLDSILEKGYNTLKGIVVGRSDFSKSYSIDKTQVDSDFIFDKVKTILLKSKEYNYQTTLGGNISKQSVDFIKKMYFQNLLDKIETRNIVIDLSKIDIENLENVIKLAIEFEIELIKYKSTSLTLTLKESNDRIEALVNR